MQDTSALDRSPFDVSSIPDDHEATSIRPSHRQRSPGDAVDALRRLAQNPNRKASEPAPEHGEEMAQPEEARQPDATEDLLSARQSTHGSFSDNARVSQSLKRTFRAELGWELLTDVERESMDMIALKFSRILSGKSLELQHWEDVVGYAKLAEKQCQPL